MFNKNHDTGLVHREGADHHLQGDVEEHLREKDGGRRLLRDTAKDQDRIEDRAVEIESVEEARRVVGHVIVAVGKNAFKMYWILLDFLF